MHTSLLAALLLPPDLLDDHELTPHRVLLVIAFAAATAAWVAFVHWLATGGLGREDQEEAEAAHLDIDLAQVPPGSPRYYTFQGTPLAVVRTTDAMLDDLQAQTAHTWHRRPLADGRPSFFVYSLRSPAGGGCEIQHVPKGTDRYAPMRPWQGGYRDPYNGYDYMNPTGDKLNRVDDILAVVNQFFIDDPAGDIDFASTTDRTGVPGANPWNLGPPNGQQRVDDILAMVKQFFHDCNG